MSVRSDNWYNFCIAAFCLVVFGGAEIKLTWWMPKPISTVEKIELLQLQPKAVLIVTITISVDWGNY